MDNRDNFQILFRIRVNNSVRRCVNFFERQLGILMHQMAFGWMQRRALNLFDYVRYHPGCVELRILRDKLLNGPERPSRLRRPRDIHARPNSFLIEAWLCNRPARTSARPDSIFWRTNMRYITSSQDADDGRPLTNLSTWALTDGRFDLMAGITIKCGKLARWQVALLANVSDQPRPRLARGVRKHDS